MEQLRARCDELSAREQMYAASWQKDSDVRQQMALEVGSMQVVLEQKNDEIRRLRQRQFDLETKVTLAIQFRSCITVELVLRQQKLIFQSSEIWHSDAPRAVIQQEK